MEKAKKTFEAQWHEALNEAEVSPPPHVWIGIDNELSNDRAAVYKKQADFYKWVAAACLLLFTIGAALFWSAGNSAEKPVIANEKELKGEGMGTNGQTTNEVAVIPAPKEEEKKNEFLVGDVSNDNKQTEPIHPDATNNNQIFANLANDKQEFKSQVPDWSTVSPKSAQLPSTVQPWSADQLYAVARTWEKLPEEFAASPLWAGVNFSSGSFDPGFGGGNADFASLDANIETFNAETAVPRSANPSTARYGSGQSVGAGVGVGKRVSKRVIVSSGIQYRAFTTGSVSRQLVSDQMDNTYALTDETNDVQLASALDQGNLTYEGQQVQLANEYQYLSIPIKAGYVLLDKKFNITLSTGLSGNFRMNSKLVADDGSDGLSNDFSTADRYENVYINFLTSMEFGYLFRDHYQFLLEPNYNQALTDFTSSSHPNRARPVNIGITVGFRYNF